MPHTYLDTKSILESLIVEYDTSEFKDRMANLKYKFGEKGISHDIFPIYIRLIFEFLSKIDVNKLRETIEDTPSNEKGIHDFEFLVKRFRKVFHEIQYKDRLITSTFVVDDIVHLRFLGNVKSPARSVVSRIDGLNKLYPLSKKMLVNKDMDKFLEVLIRSMRTLIYLTKGYIRSDLKFKSILNIPMAYLTYIVYKLYNCINEKEIDFKKIIGISIYFHSSETVEHDSSIPLIFDNDVNDYISRIFNNDNIQHVKSTNCVMITDDI